MKPITQVFDHRFPSGLDWDIADLSASIDDLATEFGLELQSWEEDGLGAARGAFVRLPSGRVVLIRVLAYAVKRFGAGIGVVADGGDVVALGIRPLIDEVVSAFGLSDSAVGWAAEEESRRKVAESLAYWTRRGGERRRK